MEGIRKTNMKNSLKNLNDRLSLGLSSQEIEDMSIRQLNKTIKKVKNEHGIPERKQHSPKNLFN